MSADHKRLNILAAKVAIIISITLVVLKFIAWFVTNSLSLQASFLDSAVDVFASAMNFFAIRHAFKPADENHRFGYGKAEALSGLAQSGFIVVSAFWLIWESIHRFFHHEPVERSLFGIFIMIFAIIMTFVLVIFQRYVVKKTNSIAIRADSLHYQTDFLTNIAVIISLILSVYFDMPVFDSIMGGVIALYILFASRNIVKESLSILMDRELDSETIERIESIVLNQREVKGIHDVRTRSSGHKYFVQLHLDLDPTLSFVEAHAVSRDVIAALKQEFESIDVCIHQDPMGFDDDDFHD